MSQDEINDHVLLDEQTRGRTQASGTLHQAHAPVTDPSSSSVFSDPVASQTAQHGAYEAVSGTSLSALNEPEMVHSMRSDPRTPLPEGVVAKRPFLRPVQRAFVLLVVCVGLLVLSTLFGQPVTNALVLPVQHVPVVPPLGSLSFASSSQLNPNSATGLNDIVSVTLSGITPPPSGMSYDAWLVGDQTQDGTVPILLGQLPVVGGRGQLTYQDKQHTDLLVHYSGFLVTERPVNAHPTLPFLNATTRLYQGSIPAIPTPGDENGYSLLSHLRHLLARDPMLHDSLGLQGGLDIWLYRNMGKVFEWSNAARDDWGRNAAQAMRDRVDSIVEYLDGQVYAFRVLPPGTPWQVDPHAGRPGILDFDTAQDEQGPPSYISHIRLHLAGLINAPGHTPAQVALATQLDETLIRIETLLKRTRSDAVQLANMSDVQLQRPAALSLLNDMQTTANDAFVGQTVGTTEEVVGGEVSLHAMMQHLASMSITALAPVQHSVTSA